MDPARKYILVTNLIHTVTGHLDDLLVKETSLMEPLIKVVALTKTLVPNLDFRNEVRIAIKARINKTDFGAKDEDDIAVMRKLMCDLQISTFEHIVDEVTNVDPPTTSNMDVMRHRFKTVTFLIKLSITKTDYLPDLVEKAIEVYNNSATIPIPVTYDEFVKLYIPEVDTVGMKDAVLNVLNSDDILKIMKGE